MFIEDPGGIIQTAWNNRRVIAAALRQASKLFTRGTLRLAIFGLGGTGKTTLGRFLSGALDPMSGPTGYEESVSLETFKLKGDIFCTLVVPPGQEHRHDYTWPELFASLAKGKSRGVINVVSYGYHSLGEGVKHTDHRIYKRLQADTSIPRVTDKRFLDAYLEDRRAVELATLGKLIPHLLQAPGKLWMITLVTKQDLWWDQRAAVREHYMSGAYNDQIQQLVAKRGGTQFHHEYLSASLLVANFMTAMGHCLKKTTAGYDHPLHTAHLRRVQEVVVSLTQA